MFYVTMTDKALSGWGLSHNKIAKLVVVCDTYEQAFAIETYAKTRSEMKYVNLTVNKPRYSTLKYCVTEREFDQLGESWKKYYKFALMRNNVNQEE